MRDQCWLVEEFEGHWRRRCFAWVPAGVGMTKWGRERRGSMLASNTVADAATPFALRSDS